MSEEYWVSGNTSRLHITDRRSHPSNIAEGAARGSKNEFIQFLYISLGSLSELETQVIIAIIDFTLERTDLREEIEKYLREAVAASLQSFKVK